KKNLKLSSARLRRIFRISRGLFLAQPFSRKELGEMRSDYFKNRAPNKSNFDVLYKSTQVGVF
ncbi:hypothetical protein COU24_02425, partial [Candidatus Kuenenbacteria bacterium CG10_big_fil_rev_8_21_14_0_10_39_14]